MPEGDAYIKVRTTPEFWQEFCVYNYRGDRLRVVLGEPDAEGFYSPVIFADATDNILRNVVLIGHRAAPVQ